jgi:hypothetical protein
MKISNDVPGQSIRIGSDRKTWENSWILEAEMRRLDLVTGFFVSERSRLKTSVSDRPDISAIFLLANPTISPAFLAGTGDFATDSNWNVTRTERRNHCS